MKLPLSWLNDYVKVDDLEPAKLADKLVNIGFEVEEIIFTGADIKEVVTGKILDKKNHDGADKLSVCMVDVGSEIITIVTGANNIKIGDIVPVAINGATLPGAINIVSKPLMGIMSQGMMCSGKELGIDDSVIDGASVDGILILPSDLELGIDITKILGLDDYVFDISLTANRADCQSIYGMAREIGAMLNRKVKPLNLKYNTVQTDKKIKVTIENTKNCSRYTGRIIEDVLIEPSPSWMKKRLRLVGHNAINNVVDITNYVLAEVGQPLHAFDIKSITDEIYVRSAYENEVIKTLDEKTYSLNPNMLVIADKVKPLAIAGVMGGEHSAVSQDTSCVFLETARFARGSVRSTSRQLGLRSDSSGRYEKGVDYESIDTGRERALALFDKLKVGKITDVKCDGDEKAAPLKIINTSSKEICKILGIDIKEKDIIKILKLLEIDVIKNGYDLECKIPMFREDIDNFTDLAEEVIRFYGYDNINSTVFKSSETIKGGLQLKQKNIQTIKEYMVGCGAYEIITYSFINNKEFNKLNYNLDDEVRHAIKILNPLSEEYAIMRTETIGSMLNSVATNLSRKNDNFRLFEVGRIYESKILPLSEMPSEKEVLSIAFVGEKESFYDIKAVVSKLLNINKINFKLEYSKMNYLHSGISADIIVDSKTIGSFGKIHPKIAKNYDLADNIYLAEIILESFISNKAQKVKFIPLAKFPAVERDLAVLVNENITVGELMESIKATGAELLESVELFDIYNGEQIENGSKSVAFSLRLRSKDHTLSDLEIQNIMNQIILNIENDFNAKLRMQ